VLGLRDRVRPVTGLGDHFDLVAAGEQRPETGTGGGVAIDHHDPEGSCSVDIHTVRPLGIAYSDNAGA
jgi:hypothetical protein